MIKVFFRVLCAFAVISLFACLPKIGPSPISMKTEQGQPVTKVEPQRTGTRENVPAGVKPRDIVAHVKTTSGGETWVDKQGNVYQNDQAQKENAAPPDRPKRSWAWAWWTGGILALLVIGDYALRRWLSVNPLSALCSLFKKVFKLS